MQNKSERYEEQKLSYILGITLTTLVFLAGTYVYILMDKQSRMFLSKGIEASLQNKVHLFEHNITQEQGINNKLALPLRHSLIESLEKSNNQSPSIPHHELQGIAQSFFDNGFSAISISNASGDILVKKGAFSKTPKLRIPLDSLKNSSLLWDKKFILNTTNKLYAHGAYIGKVNTELTMPELTSAFINVGSIGKTGEFAVCKSLINDNENMQCFINGFAGKKFLKKFPRIINDNPLPMHHALNGKSGLIFSRDYRKINVVAVYAPVGSLGLGIVVKIDQDELFSPISNNLKFIIPALILLIIFGILLFRSLVTPLVRNLILSEKETRKANIELKKSELRYQLVLDNSPYCIHEIDTEGRLLSMNPTGLKMLHLQSESEIKNTPYLDAVCNEDKLNIAQLIKKGLQGKPSNFEFKALNGHFYQSSLVPIQDEKSGVLRLMGWSQDITERKSTEQELQKHRKHLEERVKLRTAEFQESEEKYRLLFEKSNDPIWLIFKNKIIMANQSAARTLGYESTKFLINAPPPELSSELQNNSGFSFKNASKIISIAYKKGFHHFTWNYKHKNGELFPVEVSLTRIPYQNEDALFCVWRDMTAHKIAEAKLIDSKEEADQANQAKSEFLSSMSHELRTPLNAILGFSQILELDADELNDIQKENVREIFTAGTHLLNLINEVLDLSKIESGQSEISMEEVDINDVTQQSLKLIKNQADARQIEIIDKLGDQGYIVYADSTRLKQVMVNLLTNAVKYNHQNGRITLDSKVVDNQYLRISIIDTGDGLSQDDINKLFIPFQRLNTVDNIEGTGIGLVITKHLIENMGGSISVTSTPNKGSTFIIEIALFNPSIDT